jgi:hypothetical protein
MSLPASEQRALDGIAGAPRTSEPRLASMFSKLVKDDRPPSREQLSPGRLCWARLTRRLRHPVPHRRQRSAPTAPGHRRRLRLLVFSHVAAAAVLLGVLVVVLNSVVHASCAGAGWAGGLMPGRAASCLQHSGHLYDPMTTR